MDHPHPLLAWYQSDAIVLRAREFRVRDYSDTLFDTYGINFPPELVNAVNKRKAEFLYGRYTSQQALKQLGYFNHTIDIGKHRAPVFPSNVIGSITHTNDTAVCAVAHRSGVAYLGIDLEQLICEKTANNIQSQIIDSDEEQVLKKAALTANVSVTLAYSAKESIFKALYPSVGKYFNFDAVKVTNICKKKCEIEFVVNDDLSSQWVKGSSIKAQFHLHEQQVLTLVSKLNKASTIKPTQC